MALHDNPPHAVNTYTVASGTDAGGGTSLTYTLAQSNVACSIDTASATEVEMFAKKEIVVTHKVAFLTSILSPALSEGMKLVTSDRSETYHVRGISSGRQYGSIPPFTYAFCEQDL